MLQLSCVAIEFTFIGNDCSTEISPCYISLGNGSIYSNRTVTKILIFFVVNSLMRKQN